MIDLCIFSIGRNRLEKLLYISFVLPRANYLTVGIYSQLLTWLNKSNYMEYIKKMVIGYNPSKKVLLGLCPYKGSWHRIKILFMIFQTWLYFYRGLK